MKIIFTKTNFSKKTQFLLKTQIIEDNEKNIFVSKCVINENDLAKKHLRLIVLLHKKVSQAIKKHKIFTPEIVESKNNQTLFNYIKQSTLAQLIENAFYLHQPELTNKYIGIFKEIVTKMGFKEDVKSYPKKLTLITDPEQALKKFSLNRLVDLSMDNILYDPKTYEQYLLDQEWLAYEELPATYIYHQTLINLCLTQRNFIWRAATVEFPVLEVAQGIYIPKSWLKILNITPKEMNLAHVLYRQFHQQTQNITIAPEIIFYDQPIKHEQAIEVNFLTQYENEFGGQFQDFSQGRPEMSLAKITKQKDDQLKQLTMDLETKQTDLEMSHANTNNIKADLTRARNDLNKIQSARTYKVWQKVASYKEKVLKKS